MPELMVAAQPVLSVGSAAKTFGAFRALAGLDLMIGAGEVHAVVGQNGSGKSTLVKILSGYHTPDPGTTLEVGGRRVATHDASSSQAAGLRFVHQDLGLVGDLSTVENLALGVGFDTGFGGRIRWAVARKDAEQRLRSLGYEFDVDRPVKDLRAAERTGIAVARALTNLDEAHVLVIDEPTATLPPAEVDILFRAIERVRARGIGILYISHRLDEIFRIADRVTVLRDGHRVGCYDIADIDQATLVERMVGDVDLRSGHEDVDLRSGHEEGGSGDHMVSEAVLIAERLCGTTLCDVSFEARSGEVLGIAGLTGSGREEILPLLFGAVDRRGTVTVAGTEVAAGSIKSAVAVGIGLVPANRMEQGGMMAMSITDNCTITDLRRHSHPLGAISRRSRNAEVEDWMSKLDVRPRNRDSALMSLSGGNQQKVIIAKWLRMSPQVVMLDEPTQGVDVGAKATIHRLLGDAADKGASVIIASSDEVELVDTCDRVIVLSHGEIAGELRGRAITAKAIADLQY